MYVDELAARDGGQHQLKKMALLLARNLAALGAIDPTCKDTPDWQNPYGKRCDDYRVLAYCAQGHVICDFVRRRRAPTIDAEHLLISSQ